MSRKIKKKLENNFSAFDIREDAIKLCISRLDKLVSKYYNDLSVNWNIYIFDALDYYQKFDKQKNTIMLLVILHIFQEKIWANIWLIN